MLDAISAASGRCRRPARGSCPAGAPCGAAWLLSLAAVGALAAAIAPFGARSADIGFRHALRPLPRAPWGALRNKTLLAMHLQGSVPLLLEQATPPRQREGGADGGRAASGLRGGGQAWDERAVLDVCGARPAETVARGVKRVLSTIHGDLLQLVNVLLAMLASNSVEGMLRGAGGITVAEFARIRLETELAQRALDRMWLLRVLGSIFPVVRKLHKVSPPVLGPPHISDSRVANWCPELLEPGGVLHGLLASQLDDVGDTRPPGGSSMDFSWGAMGSCPFPLHRNGPTEHNFMHLLKGCREVVVLRSDVLPPEVRAASWSHRDYVFDAFDSASPAEAPPPLTGELGGNAEAWGWHGHLRPGEVLYWPGESLHQVRNVCPDTVGVEIREPWSSEPA